MFKIEEDEMFENREFCLPDWSYTTYIYMRISKTRVYIIILIETALAPTKPRPLIDNTVL